MLISQMRKLRCRVSVLTKAAERRSNGGPPVQFPEDRPRLRSRGKCHWLPRLGKVREGSHGSQRKTRNATLGFLISTGFGARNSVYLKFSRHPMSSFSHSVCQKTYA